MGQIIPAAEWLPDLPEFGNPGALTARNVIPHASGYKPFPATTVFSGALTARCQGGVFARDSGSNVYDYAGDATKLYRLSGTTWNDATRTAGGNYATNAEDYWEFAQWGETLIVTNFADEPQVITLGGPNFANLGGSPPKARHVAVVRDFVVLGNIQGQPQRVQWCAINDPTSWTPAATTQADYQDIMDDGGWVQKVIGGEFGIILKERSIWRMTYVGSPLVFQFDQIEQRRGAYAPQGAIGYGGMVFYVANDGFYVTVGSGPSQPIGDGKVDKTFFDELNQSYWYRINATIDPINKLVLWAYPTSDSIGGNPDKMLIYNWVHKRWASVSLTQEMFVNYAAMGYTLDSLDTVSSSLDVLATSLDSRSWTGGQVVMAQFDSNHNLALFNGSAMDAVVDTAEAQHFPGRRANVTKIRPLVDGASATVQVGTRNILSESEAFGSAVSQNATGECPVRTNSRYNRYRINTTGSFNFIQGVEVDATPGSVR